MIGRVIASGFLAAAAIVCFALSWRQFLEKGFLFNNAYIYASGKEREQLDKKPYYRQRGVVLLLCGLIFALNAANVFLRTRWLFWAVLALAAAAIIYAVISTLRIKKQEAKTDSPGP